MYIYQYMYLYSVCMVVCIVVCRHIFYILYYIYGLVSLAAVVRVVLPPHRCHSLV